MQSVVDINVLIPLLMEKHAHHPVAWNWWEGRGEGSVLLCWPVRMGVLRLLTNSRVTNGAPLSPGQALHVWDQLSGDSRCRWSEPQPQHESFFRRFVSGRAPTPNLWTDAWLAAHAKSTGCAITSFDADFHVFGCSAFEHLTP